MNGSGEGEGNGEGEDARPPVRVRLSADAERRIRQGHPWVFDRSIREIRDRSDGAGTRDPGRLAVVYDGSNRFLAVGFWDPESPIRIRVLQAGRPAVIDARFWERRFEDALSRRRRFLNAPETTGYRLIHGENDGFPGLVVDRYEAVAVAKLYSPAWIPWFPVVADALMRAAPDLRSIVVRLNRSHEADWENAGYVDGETRRGEPIVHPVVFSENGMRFEADVLRGQKTGFFLDHRDNRLRVRHHSSGCRVLNLFSFSGAFSVAAAFGGARSVTDVDISAHALEQGRRNFALNAVGAHSSTARCERIAIKADAFRWIAGEVPTAGYDLVVVDPPSLAKREADRSAALAAYGHLAARASDAVGRRSGGLLVCASCSAHVRPDEFRELVLSAVRTRGRDAKLIAFTETPDDHPATFAEARYLKTAFLQIA